MDIEWDRQRATDPPVRPACLVPGCPVQGPSHHLVAPRRILLDVGRRTMARRPTASSHADPDWPMILDPSGTV